MSSENTNESEAARKTRIAQAKTHTKQSSTRLDQAKTKSEQSNTRSQQAETHAAQANTQTEQNKTHSEQSNTRSQQAETKSDQANTQVEQASTRSQQAETQATQSSTHTEQNKTHSEQSSTRSQQAETSSNQANTQAEQATIRSQQAETKSDQADTHAKQAGTRSQQTETQAIQATTHIEQTNTRTEQARIWEMEIALRASELSYRRLFEAAQDGILILEVETGRITDVNPFLEKLLGFSHAETVGKTVAELSPFQDVVSNKAMLELLKKDGYVRYEDLPLETRDGRHIAVEFVSNVYQAGEKKVIQCNIRDITARKKGQEASVLLTAIVESSEDAIIGKDLNGIVTSWNRGAEKIFGYTLAEMLGQSIMKLIPVERHDEEKLILEKIRRGG